MDVRIRGSEDPWGIESLLANLWFHAQPEANGCVQLLEFRACAPYLGPIPMHVVKVQHRASTIPGRNRMLQDIHTCIVCVSEET